MNTLADIIKNFGDSVDRNTGIVASAITTINTGPTGDVVTPDQLTKLQTINDTLDQNNDALAKAVALKVTPPTPPVPAT